ncbi:PREDICTED: matrix-remodeling-associated protein 7 [Ficedula albicollis]|uniref:matrix-remodeling-associated protein 7 n=1 Tax=Ficedula albicollis TaxID=59894 RepID=UPI000359658C|nr:PREDICTED: matrix-remodeling-associated protein 7 [Ficedula albicollis]
MSELTKPWLDARIRQSRVARSPSFPLPLAPSQIPPWVRVDAGGERGLAPAAGSEGAVGAGPGGPWRWAGPADDAGPEPRQPGHRDDAESKIPPLAASPGSSLGHTGQAEDTSGHAALSSHAEEEEVDSENEKLVVREPEDEDAADETFSFKYSPGKLRGNQYKSMMSKEELEEEQRVQREQLAAIFRLMKEKSDTFGEMSEGDMKEQLRLYDI